MFISFCLFIMQVIDMTNNIISELENSEKRNENEEKNNLMKNEDNLKNYNN